MEKSHALSFRPSKASGGISQAPGISTEAEKSRPFTATRMAGEFYDESTNLINCNAVHQRMTHPPIFVLAAPRSGSTVFFELFGSHRDFAWVTNYEEKFPHLYCGGVLRRLLESKYWHISGGKKEYVARQWYNRILPKPSEGYEFWTRETDADFHRSWLWTTRANAQTSRKLQRITARVQFWQGKPRFATKFTGLGRIAGRSGPYHNSNTHGLCAQTMNGKRK